MASRSHFDYIIIGSGLAGLQLALEMSADTFFNNKQIAIIDSSEKKTNDKTWSFWEVGDSNWGNLAYKSWKNARVITSKRHLHLRLSPYQYKSIKSIDFYNYTKAALKEHNNIHFISDEVEHTHEGTNVTVKTKQHSYTANHVFDSRIPAEFYNDNNNITIQQHFKGIVIKTPDAIFDEETFTMMDYRLKDGEQTTFTYVLPFSKHEALVEFTYFTEGIVETSVYDSFIKTYIKEYLNIESYNILESEQGVIPMTTFPFDNLNTENITKIGTGGGWVKPSTGYSFKHTEKKVAKIIENIKTHKIPSSGLFQKKYKFYDKVFLKVLQDENHKGEWIFQQFYDKNTIDTMFRFLDEESTLAEELKIMASLFSWSFIKAFFKTL